MREEVEIEMTKVNKIIKKTAEETAGEVIHKLRCKNMLKGEINYYKRVELLLYNYMNLIDAVKQKDEDIGDLEKHGIPQASKSIVVYSSSAGSVTAEDRYIQLREKYLFEKQETERDIRRIDKALDKIRDDKYFAIIEMKYLNNNIDNKNNVTDEYLAEQLQKSSKTIMRNRKRLMKRLIIIFFPESIKDII